jgi:uncharacterized protein YPO0396
MATRELTPAETAAGIRNINDTDLTATQVQALVRNMDASKQKWARIKSNKKEYEEKLQGENEMLYYNYPSLFQMHAEDRLDNTFFEMLALKRKIEKGEITPEQATTVIGQKLHQRFLPQEAQAAPAATMSYEEFYKQSTP